MLGEEAAKECAYEYNFDVSSSLFSGGGVLTTSLDGWRILRFLPTIDEIRRVGRIWVPPSP
jgi:hypothetical protein